MSLETQVRAMMMQALKDKDTVKKDALSGLLSALKAKAIDKRSELSSEEEVAVVAYEVKQLKETIATAPPSGYENIISDAKNRIDILSEFLPEQMSADEIRDTIKKVLDDLNLTAPTMKEKGIIMKNLMPLTKGKADGKEVNDILAEFFS